MKCFIAYFDYLGFKEFIERNNLDFQIQIMGNNFRDIENALGKGKLKETHRGVVADLSNSKLNCINFSDTVIFWTNDDTDASIIELLEVSYKFNWQAIDFCFPVRGAIVYGDIYHVGFNQNNGGGGVYNVNSVFGKGLVCAHLKANDQHWAGTVLDESFINEINKRNINSEEFLIPYAKRYKVPYKKEKDIDEEYVLNIINGNLNEEALNNFSKHIINNFSQYNKPVDKPDVQEKLANTLRFLESYYIKEK